MILDHIFLGDMLLFDLYYFFYFLYYISNPVVCCKLLCRCMQNHNDDTIKTSDTVH